ncbi:ImmA/IrrE family metallo-endopeptidase [Macrococcoides bohemicum]|uniref:ImmA/IrrE family metallo-endopeptidase n=2 Tax=Macrococcoides TaxID=3076173 RepID=UPI00165E4FEA|nr:ImmA/IrrE family metallo-endopeptidase [Macrococcus bohemicus]MBC9873854.1 ImmA/IrrE family metallo-endopeptidase [Macrococcus bohemicus]
MKDTEVIELALKFRRETLMLADEQPIEDSYRLAEEAGFFIFSIPLKGAFDKNSENGFYLKINGYNFIFINSSVFKATQNFTIWHEIYHWIMPLESKDDKDRDEIQAEIFAASILLPPPTLKKEISPFLHSNKIYANQINKIAVKFGLHYKAVVKQIERVSPKLLEDKPYLHNIKYSEDIKFFNENEKLKYAELSKTNNRYITPKIFEVIEENYKKNIITEDELKEINRIIKEVSLIGNE